MTKIIRNRETVNCWDKKDVLAKCEHLCAFIQKNKNDIAKSLMSGDADEFLFAVGVEEDTGELYTRNAISYKKDSVA